MAFDKSTTSGDVGELSADIIERLLAKEIYGHSLDEILTIAIDRGLSRGLSEGYAAGYKRGHANGYRSAKGGKKSSKHIAKTKDVVAITVGKLGCWANQKLFTRAAIDVLSCIEAGTAEPSNQERPKDVTAFLKSPRPGNWPGGWPRQTTLLSEYSRQRAKRNRQAERAAAELLRKLQGGRGE